MVFVFCSIRISRNIPCLSPLLKLPLTTYSTKVTSSIKKFTSTQRHYYLSAAKYAQTQTQTKASTSFDHKKSTARKGAGNNTQKDIPLNESEWRDMTLNPVKLQDHCFMLSKIRLTSLVVVTTMAGYALAPGPFDITTFLACAVGTGMLSATANSINQFFEVPFDSQMSRTKNRVLVRGYLTPAHAMTFAAISGFGGLALLINEVNGLTAILGLSNLILYSLIYTPMKRISILNTWVGSIVGAIPPLMGWAACVGNVMSPGAWIMSGLLYAWQFPHFNALSWNLRPDYSRAGYRMMAVTNPNLCRKTALRYTVALTGLCYLAPAMDVTNWWFALTSTPLNAYFLYLAWKFYKHSDSGNSRKLFRFSLIHLPVLMILMLVNKKYWFIEKQEDMAKYKENQTGGYSFITGVFDNLAKNFHQKS
ncbi:protoheme IX farnesyltransferase, mitochondrial isoform X1 [Colletes gigas]|uniref:protoheme IX farnesyltransferase, mitochondrial isoform X1 n=1 Tax=Colletes gigas TaxID=935657 RepID=UPI001C9AC1C7|nr:protoheme IX farnesyltransferase, mitochondrial isoform X1 [Colletes gigas]XP_043248445.1 protoheme IX farnesyltransferase, mitochondrial isoform X1 [Colletes gigas]